MSEAFTSGRGGAAGHGEALTHDEVSELAGLYVLGALEGDDERRVREHLTTCPEPHPEVADLGGVVQALATLVEPLDAPAGLKSRVMDDYRRESAAGPTAPIWEMPVTSDMPTAVAVARRAPQRSWLGWAAAAVAVLMIGVVGAWGLNAQARADHESQRAATMAAALEVLGAPDSEVAVLRGTADASGASGFAAFSPAGTGYVVVTGLPQLPADQAYQAWYIVGDEPVSAGLMSLDPDGFAVLARIPHHAGTNVIALTREPLGGVDAPTSAPIVAGELRPA